MTDPVREKAVTLTIEVLSTMIEVHGIRAMIEAAHGACEWRLINALEPEAETDLIRAHMVLERLMVQMKK